MEAGGSASSRAHPAPEGPGTRTDATAQLAHERDTKGGPPGPQPELCDGRETGGESTSRQRGWTVARAASEGEGRPIPAVSALGKPGVKEAGQGEKVVPVQPVELQRNAGRVLANHRAAQLHPPIAGQRQGNGE